MVRKNVTLKRSKKVGLSYEEALAKVKADLVEIHERLHCNDGGLIPTIKPIDGSPFYKVEWEITQPIR